MAQPASYGSLPFREQNEFLRRKLPDVDYWAVRGAAHDHSFVVAGANRTDLVADIHQVLQRAMDDGDTLESFRENFFAVLDHYGWQPEGGRAWRSRVIYETNLRTSYAAGRYQQLQAVKATRPYWQYEHSDAVITPRPQHAAWDGLVIHADDPWWQVHYPPNGWGCQCRVRALNERDLHRLGKTGPDAAPESKLRQVQYKGQTMDVPAGVDPGWDYAPGRSALERQVQLALDKTARLPAAPAAQLNEQLLANTSVSAAIQADWVRWLDSVASANQARNLRFAVGSLSPRVVTGLEARQITPQTAVISMQDRDLLHILRDVKAAAVTADGLPKGLSVAELAELPQILAQPQAVLLDVAHSTLLYVFAAERREAGKVVVQVNFPSKGTDRKTLVDNKVRTASLIDWQNIHKEVNNGKLVLLEGAL